MEIRRSKIWRFIVPACRKKLKFHDGMIGVIEEKGKDYLYISTRKPKFIDWITLGYFPKPNYEQIGQYHGNTEGFNEGDIVEVFFKKESNSFKKVAKQMLMIYGNIEFVGKLSSGKKLTRWEKIKEFFSIRS